jgi:CRP/FNR family transcriptional regulator
MNTATNVQLRPTSAAPAALLANHALRHFDAPPAAPATESMRGLLAEFRSATILNVLRRCDLFAGLPEADLQAIAAATALKWLAKGDYVFREGEPVAGFYVVHQGAIKLHRLGPSGQEQIVRIARPGHSFAEEALLSGAGHLAHACALEASHVLLIQKAGFLALLQRRPELALCLLKSMSRQFNHLVHLLDDLTLKDVKTRLAQWLLQRCADPLSQAPVKIELRGTKRLLAAELGAASETFSRTLGKLRDQKLLAIEGNALTLLCPAKLARLCGWARANQPVRLSASEADSEAWSFANEPSAVWSNGHSHKPAKRATRLKVPTAKTPTVRLPKKPRR